jgi:hypothetical protein
VAVDVGAGLFKICPAILDNDRQCERDDEFSAQPLGFVIGHGDRFEFGVRAALSRPEKTAPWSACFCPAHA